jgi:hypothetical protein
VEERLPNLPYLIFGAVLVAAVVFLIVKATGLYTDEFPVEKVRLVELLNQWHGPSELVSFPPPRSVQFTGQAKGMLAFAVSGMVGIIVVTLFVLMPQMERQKQRDTLIRQEGLLSQGTVTRTWITRNKSSRDYHVSYTYQVSGIVHSSEAQVNSNTYSHLAPHSSLTLRYAPSHPEFSKLDGEIERPAWVPYLVLLPIVPFAVISYFVWSQKKLLEWGQAVGAVVTRVAPTKGGKSVSYKFLDFAGNTITGSSTMKSSDAPAIGAIVTALYDPDKSRANVLYPCSFVRLRNPSRP